MYCQALISQILVEVEVAAQCAIHTVLHVISGSS